eukprot:13947746-Heterocapsa_arctica.AAC.1
MRDPFPIVTVMTEGLEWHTVHLVLSSVHIPHSQRHDAEVFDAANCLSQILYIPSRSRVIVGADANICLPVTDSEPLACAHSPHARVEGDARAVYFERLLQMHSARVFVEPMTDDTILFTQRAWSDGTLSMRYYIIDTLPQPCARDTFWVEQEWYVKSDHRPVVAELHSSVVPFKFLPGKTQGLEMLGL